MIITIEKYNSLTREELKDIKYSNPSYIDENNIRVGEVFDEDLGCWESANESDF